MSSPKSFGIHLLSLSLFCLAGALVYFTVTLAGIASDLPVLIKEVQAAQDRFDPVVEEAHSIQALIPEILDQSERIRQEIGPIVDEVGSLREQLPSLLEEASRYREAIPSVLQEAAAYREQIPALLEQIESIQLQIPPLLAEIENARETIPSILAEVEAVREAIPGYLREANEISQNLDTIGQKAGEGAVQGVVTGIIKTPVNLMSNLGNNVLSASQFTEADKAILKDTVASLIRDGAVGDQMDWKNPKTGARGTITILSLSEEETIECLRLHFKSFKRLKKIADADIEICGDENGDWKVVDD